MTPLKFRGITWNHSRALPPLVAASQRYEELHPEFRFQWDKRSLDEFGHASIADLAQQYDLLIIDHPMLGEIHRDGLLMDLNPLLQSDSIASLEQDALGPCLDCYQYEGHLYALPIDAAAPAASYRPNLLAQLGKEPPATWDELMDLAGHGVVCMPGFPADLFLNFVAMCASRSCMNASPVQFLDRAVAAVCLEEFAALAQLMPQTIYSMNPIDIYERMASSDDFAYCPFAYTYSNYARPGFATHELIFANPVTLRGGAPLRTILGGTGIAISSRCKHFAPAAEFCVFVASPTCQTHLYGICGGQPASKTAWQSDILNSVSSSFFTRTIKSIEDAIIRPRYAGYIGLQASGGKILARHLRGDLACDQALDQLEELYRESQEGTRSTEVAP